jgi:hypothetical protein
VAGGARAGQDDLKTTQIYINEALVFDPEPFGGVFLALLDLDPEHGPGFRPDIASFATPERQNWLFSRCFWASPAGFEPALAT